MIDKEMFRLKALRRIDDAKPFCRDWHNTARDDYAFIAGDQWQPEDVELLKLQQRPDVTFNYSEKMIDAVQGAEVSNRQEVSYKPRGIEDMNLAELWSNAGRWVRDECFAEDEETDAFRDTLITGMGWVATKMDYSENKDGMPIMFRDDPVEMYWDAASIKPGLSDRRWDAKATWMDNEEIKAKWPGNLVFDLDEDGPQGTGIIRTGFRYQEDDVSADDEEMHKDQSQVWDYQCVELEPYYRVDAGNGEIGELSAADFSKMKKQLDAFKLQYVKQFKKVYYRAFFAGETLLEYDLSPCQHGFTRHCITGKRDHNKNTWYGLTRVMKDPQRWANKWLAQIMHIINTNAKGGLLAEENAFVDPRKAQDEWSSPDSVTLLKEGGLTKVKEKGMAAYPSGLAQLMEFALNSLPQVTGINLEALGLANRDQANVLEQSRKQAAYGLLAPVFDSLRRYRKMQGKVLLYFITEYISDGRLIKINGVGSEQYIPLTKAPDAVTFDIIVDQSPSAPDVKTQTWSVLENIIPAMIKAGYPIPPDILQYAPLPSGLIQAWQKFMLEQQKQQQVDPKMVEQMQQQMQKLTEENQQLKTDHSIQEQELQLKVEEARAKLEMEREQMRVDIQLQREKANHDITMQQESQQAQGELNKQKVQGDHKIKAATAGLNPDQQGEVKIKLDSGIEDMSGAIKQITEQFTQALAGVVQAMNAPKEAVRDANGRLVGVRPVQQVQ